MKYLSQAAVLSVVILIQCFSSTASGAIEGSSDPPPSRTEVLRRNAQSVPGSETIFMKSPERAGNVKQKVSDDFDAASMANIRDRLKASAEFSSKSSLSVAAKPQTHPEFGPPGYGPHKIDSDLYTANTFSVLPKKMHPAAVAVTERANDKLRWLQYGMTHRERFLGHTNIHPTSDKEWRQLASKQQKTAFKEMCCAQDTHDRMDPQARRHLQRYCKWERQQKIGKGLDDALEHAKWLICCPCAYLKSRLAESAAAPASSLPEGGEGRSVRGKSSRSSIEMP